MNDLVLFRILIAFCLLLILAVAVFAIVLALRYAGVPS